MHHIASLRNHVRNFSPGMASATSMMPFNLDISGVAGFFAGDVTLTAMNTVHIYGGRRWLGWYNQPGTYEVARRYGQLPRAPFWDAIHPGPNLDPAVLFKLDRTESNTRYSYAHPAAEGCDTTYAARLFLEECRATSADRSKKLVTSHDATPMGSVTIVKLPNNPTGYEGRVERLHQTPLRKIVAAMTILSSLAAAVGCGLLGDWACFSMVLLGMVTNGMAHFVLSGRDLQFETSETVALTDGDAPRAGVLYGGDDLVVLTGPKSALRAITKGHFILRYPNDSPDSKYHNIGICSTILSLQFLAQLLVVPLGQLPGQLLFIGSLAISWAYNTYLSSSSLETLLRRLLVQNVLGIRRDISQPTSADTAEKGGQQQGDMELEQYWLSRNDARVILALLFLVPNVPAESDAAVMAVLSQVLNDLLPLNTPMWILWKSEVLRNIEENLDKLRDTRFGSLDGVNFATGLSRHVPEKLRRGAQSALKQYIKYRNRD